MANSKDLNEKTLDSLLAAPLMKLGFSRAERLIFKREADGVRQLLRFPTRIELDVMLFNVNGAVRFAEIEKLLGNTDPLEPTLMIPLHLLTGNKRQFIEWRFIAESSSSAVDQALADCIQYLLPFFEKMSLVEALKSQLFYEIEHYGNVARERAKLASESERTQFDMRLQNDGRLRLVLSLEQRVEKLAAIYVLEGNKDSAARLIDSEMAKLKGARLPPQIAQRLRLERLRKKLLDRE